MAARFRDGIGCSLFSSPVCTTTSPIPVDVRDVLGQHDDNVTIRISETEWGRLPKKSALTAASVDSEAAVLGGPSHGPAGIIFPTSMPSSLQLELDTCQASGLHMYLLSSRLQRTLMYSFESGQNCECFHPTACHLETSLAKGTVRPSCIGRPSRCAPGPGTQVRST